MTFRARRFGPVIPFAAFDVELLNCTALDGQHHLDPDGVRLPINYVLYQEG
jgi:hypothetical protein